jgi:hypothetical protein
VSVYRPGRSPYSKMKYLGPVEPSLARQFIMALGGPSEWIEWELSLKSEPGASSVQGSSEPQQPSSPELNAPPSSSPSSEPSHQESGQEADHTEDSG